MTQYLAFVLHAQPAAFGAVAVGERRPGWDRPGRSALLGLVAGALGIDRDREEAHLALEGGYGIAIRTDAAGRVLADYHTAQVPPARRGQMLPTRAAELAMPRWKLETVLTRRDYRTDALHVIALWARDAAPHALNALHRALLAPIYAPYIGRKSCPLTLPLGPLLIEAETPAAALAARADAAAEPERRLRKILGARAGTVTLDAADAAPRDITRIERRRDRLASRARWQFSLREEAVLRAAPAP